MRLSGPACRLTAIVGGSDTYHHRPLYTEIVHRAHAAGLAGASVQRGIAGYGRTQRIHTTGVLGVGDDLPVAVTIVDTRERIEAFLPQLHAVVDGGLVTLDDVDVVRYTAGG